MTFNPGLKIGQEITNSDIVDIFKCGNMGGMRRSYATNTLVLISDYTKGLYHDKWIGGTLHYTGMGKSGDQDINKAQNKTLANCMNNDVDIHLLTELFNGVKTSKTPVIVERIVKDIDDIVRIVRFDGWQDTTTGRKTVKKEVRAVISVRYGIKDKDVFKKAYSYIEQYY